MLNTYLHDNYRVRRHCKNTTKASGDVDRESILSAKRRERERGRC